MKLNELYMDKGRKYSHFINMAISVDIALKTLKSKGMFLESRWKKACHKNFSFSVCEMC